jgi:AraC-like DNA-binding protein
MENRYFAPWALAVLLDARRWRLVCSLFKPDSRPLLTPRLRAWARAGAETHPQQEVIIALRGRGFFGFQGAVYPCRPGEVFFMDSHEPHSYPYPSFYPDCDHFLIQVLKDTILFRLYSCRGGKELPRRTPNRVLGGAVAAHLLQECLARLKREPGLPHGFRRHSLLAVLSLLVSEVVDQGFLPEAETRESPRARHAKLAGVVRQHLCDTLGRGVSLDSLAALTAYSKHHLLRVFREETGQTIHQYLDSVRVTAARDLLAQGISKKELSQRLGFSSPPSLSRWLRARCPKLIAERRPL